MVLFKEALDNNNFEEALYHLNEYLNNRSDDGTAHYYKATLLTRMGRIEESIYEYEVASKLDDTLQGAHLILGDHYYENGRFKEAMWRYNAANKVGKIKETYIKCASAAMATGELKEAEKSFKAAIELEKGKKTYLYKELAKVYSEQGEAKKEEKYLNLAYENA